MPSRLEIHDGLAIMTAASQNIDKLPNDLDGYIKQLRAQLTNIITNRLLILIEETGETVDKLLNDLIESAIKLLMNYLEQRKASLSEGSRQQIQEGLKCINKDIKEHLSSLQL